MGKASDAEVGRRLKRSKGSVQQRRIKLHVVAHNPPRSPTPPRRWTAREDRLLGTALDRDVARVLGRNTRGVASRRHALGIPSFTWTRYRKSIESLAAQAAKPRQ